MTLFSVSHGNSISNETKKVLGDAEILGSLAEFPARIKCATLAWHAAKEALKGEAK